MNRVRRRLLSLLAGHAPGWIADWAADRLAGFRGPMPTTITIPPGMGGRYLITVADLSEVRDLADGDVIDISLETERIRVVELGE